MNKWEGDIFMANESHRKKAVLLEGARKSGKTTFASTAPKPFFLDCDGGTESIADKTIPCINIPVRMGEEEKKKYGTPYRKIIAYLLWAKDNSGPFAPDGELADRETIVIDSMSHYCDMEWIRLHEVMGVDLVALGKVSKFDPCWQQLKNGLIYINSIIKAIKEEGHMDVITTAHLQITERENKPTKGEASILGGFRDKIDSYYDDILYTQKLGSKYLIHTQGLNHDGIFFDGNTRTQGLEKTLQDPTWDKLYK